MAAGDGETAALRAEVAALRLRVQELERDNQRLAKIASSCSCGSKEENIASSPVASASLYGSDQEVQRNGKSHESRTSGHDVSFPFDHMATSTENEVPCSGNAGGHGLPKNSSKCANRTGHQVGIVSHCPKQLVALQVMYFGQRFYGFASEAHTEPTVESEIFKALERAKLLVGSRKESCYSRCGRTDKGVSATGQVISLYLRSNIKDAGGNVLDERFEIDYVKVLNRILPRDIRVIGWCPVAADFLARFSCLGREYKYLFWKGSLDISVMQKAASKFIGEHDFRNFCKMDAVNVSNYRRKITDFNISAYDQRSNNDELWAMTIKGSAFLWHQVRCMVAVLFLIGQGLESPCVHELSILGPYTCMDDSLRLDWCKFKDLMQDSLESLMQVYKCMLNSQVHGSRWNIHASLRTVVDSLLDITKTPRKPQYKMAPELPLILRSCLFDKVNFMCSSDASQALIEHLKDEYHQYMLQAAIFHEALSCLSFTERNSFQPHQKKRNHILLMSRQTEPSYDERVAKVKTKSTDSM